MSLEAFGVKNLRCLTDTGLVPIRRITVLVGKNSSGKSTFLRTFPLLQQSVRTKRNSPILWYGDGHPVDFGSLQEAASHWLAEPSVTFMFRVRLPEGYWSQATAERVIDSQFEVTVAGSEVPHVRDYMLQVDGRRLRCSFDERGRVTCIQLGTTTVRLEGRLSLGGQAYLLPNMLPGEASGISYVGTSDFVSERLEHQHLESDIFLLSPLLEELQKSYSSNTDQFVALLGFPVLREHLTAFLGQVSDTPSFKRKADAKVDVGAIADKSIIRWFPYFIRNFDYWLSRFARNVAYLAPLRVSAQRAYRVTNIAVDEVDPEGGNLAMFLRSLSPGEVESFATFTRQALGFETKVRTTGMHAEILVRQGASPTFNNLIDVGFGFSEVLPLAAVVWNSCIRPTIEQRTPVSLVAIEQPELHLHPAHQAKLARMFATAALGSADTKILLETHSESLINGFGKLIHEGVLKADDVQIVLFDQEEDTQQTTVRLAGYRESGALYDWPYGFLSPVAERRAPRAAAE